MQIGGGNLTQVIGGMGLDRMQPNRPANKPVEAVPPINSRNPPPDNFQPGLLHARAVEAAPKADQPLPPPNPNLPRGSLINLKV
ncbi:MAG: hypothetical protein HOJ21_12605 [Alphaproteobacteria bacterium]|jgi:hypothetical protein|nr:hypothetical protein [Alphaproteobacteria bacterium]